LSDSREASSSRFGHQQNHKLLKRRSAEEEAGLAEPDPVLSSEAPLDLPDGVPEEDLVCLNTEINGEIILDRDEADIDVDTVASGHRSPPPQYPASEASTSVSRPPPPFSSLFGYCPDPDVAAASAASQFQDETKRALPQDTKGQSSRSSKDEEAEPPPAYSEGSSPLLSFTYLMAAAGGASSIITQVQQGGPPINTLGGTTLLLSETNEEQVLTHAYARCRRG
jgi:hypothetical protein